MKWKRIATEFLPEKTFLIIKDDPGTLAAKENSTRREKSKSAADTGTWPPKLKNHHHRYHQNRSCIVNGERPKTANLEKPSVLDPRLLKKLDMSLVSKESLCHSMTRIHPGATRGGGGTTSTTKGGGSSRRRQSVPVGEKSTSYASSIPRKLPSGFNDEEQEKSLSSLPSAGLASKKHSSHEHFTANDASRTEIRSELSSMKKQTSRHNIRSEDENFTKKRIFDAKRLDDNNNGNNNPPSTITNNNNNDDNDDNNTPPKISSLSTVRKNKFSRNGVSTELEVFTGATTKNNAPEPCKTCGRPDQPERFHSHPRGATVVTKKDIGKDSLTNEKGKISVPKTIQKPVALNFRSEKNKKSKARENEALTKGQKSNDPSPCDIEADKGREITMSAVRRGPKTVTCYICAREFGTASFPIHEPKCMQKWERENNTLPPSQRRPKPQRPIVPVDHYDWNNAAWEQSQAQLIPCWHCGRTFLPDRVEIHQRSCKSTRKAGSSGGSPTIERPEKNDQQNRTLTGPVTVVCQYCGRNFGSRSIKIHEPQCIKKLQNEKESASSSTQRRKIISKYERSVDNVAGDLVSSSSSARLTGLQKPTTTCYICGRDFGSASIDIHEPQCLIKWQNENSKLPPHQQRKEPQKPEIIYTTDDSETSAIDWAATTEARWRSHLGQLVPCKHCKRTFNPDRVVIHERSCKGVR